MTNIEPEPQDRPLEIALLEKNLSNLKFCADELDCGRDPLNAIRPGLDYLKRWYEIREAEAFTRELLKALREDGNVQILPISLSPEERFYVIQGGSWTFCSREDDLSEVRRLTESLYLPGAKAQTSDKPDQIKTALAQGQKVVFRPPLLGV